MPPAEPNTRLPSELAPSVLVVCLYIRFRGARVSRTTAESSDGTLIHPQHSCIHDRRLQPCKNDDDRKKSNGLWLPYRTRLGIALKFGVPEHRVREPNNTAIKITSTN